MQTNLLWTGIEYYSLENCLVNTTDVGTEINSVIVGKYNEDIYRVEYKVKTNQNWETIYVELKSQQKNERQKLLFESDGKGNWMRDGRQMDELKGCIDIDIPLSPFTNTLPINRLKMALNDEQIVKVIYINLLEKKIELVKQKYVRLSQNVYHFENVPKDFEADIEVDDLGFVVDYPLLFLRSGKSRTSYP